MPIITISRDSYSKGKEVAETLAKKLDCRCVSREIVLEASKEFDIPEIKLTRALHDPISVLDRFTHGRERYISYFRSSLLNLLKKDNVVYHGLAGHFLLQNLSRVLKVRIISDIEERVKEEMKRENISAEKALFILNKDDEERRKWGILLYGKDPWDPRYYDVVINIKSLTVEDAVQTLYDIVQKPIFQASKATNKVLIEAALIADIEARIFEYAPKVLVTVKDGVVLLQNVGKPAKRDTQLKSKIEEILGSIKGVKEVRFGETFTDKHAYINVFHNVE